jgi:transposase-like protein
MANGVNANMVIKWRREYRAGVLGDMPEARTTLLPQKSAANFAVGRGVQPRG